MGTMLVHAVAAVLATVSPSADLVIAPASGATVITAPVNSASAAWGLSVPAGPLLFGRSRDVFLQIGLPGSVATAAGTVTEEVTGGGGGGNHFLNVTLDAGAVRATARGEVIGSDEAACGLAEFRVEFIKVLSEAAAAKPTTESLSMAIQVHHSPSLTLYDAMPYQSFEASILTALARDNRS